MAATLILWGHALAALLFGALAQGERGRVAEAGRPRAALIAALAITALWALAVAGIDADDVSTHVAQSARSVAWLYLVIVLSRREGAAGRSVIGLAAVVVAVLTVEAILSLVAIQPGGAVHGRVAATRALLAAMTTTGALVLLSHFAQTSAARRSGQRRMLVYALAVMWSADLAVAVAAALRPSLILPATVLRGPLMAVSALLMAAAGADRGVAPPSVSRSLVMRLLVLAALAAYAGVTAMAADLAATFAGGAARAAQTVVVFGFTAALLAFASTPWLRAWMRVTVAKHLFGHRYDYRVEWQRFTATLGLPGEQAAPLGTRIVKAVADLTDSPAGLLLSLDDASASTVAAWHWAEADRERLIDPGFVRHLTATGRILSLDALRAGQGVAEEAAVVPRWLLDDQDAWAVVPLLHGGTLIGAIVLARPPVDRALDWEDFDLLRIVGRQTASYLAEERAHAALADAQRFDEFNRRFAFLMHDIKNVASQLTLVARNAERHADNPDFRADMLATLRDSAGRMTTLLARLGQHDGGRPEALQATDVAALAARATGLRRAQHAIRLDAPAACLAHAHPARLEQALGHLLQNAVEASADGEPVVVTVRAEAAGVLIAIADRGCGMSAGFVRDQLFRPFASSKPTGFGIGAYEARQLIHAMGGRIEVVSQEGAGTEFRILLPAAAPVSLPDASLEIAA
ncbi:PEP-CTERM system histidine kinase PrsK [Sphingomonas sp. KR1UV-12]|uniref:histidine kinase n=1 Tax=Sphingomonas aurea TaxID=3063994 RepID=A0ABT9EN60_9SPHN|nr:XrtA/PEP-CTERM system histidine kinase PrsK [Sphingomonas sp. KR1UV-12]MDP1028395.1 PEP-CTERM system histidine kinase PrsK [Sphingomonas sp. KR1UV-12]